jgi:hypothetical protein
LCTRETKQRALRSRCETWHRRTARCSSSLTQTTQSTRKRCGLFRSLPTRTSAWYVAPVVVSVVAAVVVHVVGDVVTIDAAVVVESVVVLAVVALTVACAIWRGSVVVVLLELVLVVFFIFIFPRAVCIVSGLQRRIRNASRGDA